MNRSVKLGLYAVCIVGLMVFGFLMMRSYRQANQASEQRKERVNNVTGIEATNVVEGTNVAEVTNATEITNVAAAATNITGTNISDAATNAAATNVVEKKDADPDVPQVSGVATRGYTRMITYGLGLLVFFLGLAALIGYEVAQFLGTRAQEALFNDDGQPADPEYEKAEALWTNGQYLESVRAMREYLEKNPREQYVALRIAEIYEENLNNPLAAALEYEEVLTKKLPPERWGWAAIHLANIYSGKMNQPDKAVALLRRIDAEYGATAAAKKARERLLQIDPNFVPAEQPAIEEQETTASEPPPRPSNLPPGFRPKS